jgi:hypothetical protein
MISSSETAASITHGETGDFRGGKLEGVFVMRVFSVFLVIAYRGYPPGGYFVNSYIASLVQEGKKYPVVRCLIVADDQNLSYRIIFICFLSAKNRTKFMQYS